MINNKWPKVLPVLTDEQKKIKESFMIKWHETLPGKYSIIEQFNHRGAFRGITVPKPCRTLEIGAGLGAHIGFEDLSGQEYYALELLPEMARRIKERFPAVKVTVGDVQGKLDFPDNYFDRIVAVHVLEHLPNLPAALNELKRLLKPDGFCQFVLPCEGGFAYSLARMVSAKRIFEKTYHTPYDWCIKSEHVNNYREIIDEIKNTGFKITRKIFFPFPLPFVFCNLAVGMYIK